MSCHRPVRQGEPAGAVAVLRGGRRGLLGAGLIRARRPGVRRGGVAGPVAAGLPVGLAVLAAPGFGPRPAPFAGSLLSTAPQNQSVPGAATTGVKNSAAPIRVLTWHSGRVPAYGCPRIG